MLGSVAYSACIGSLFGRQSLLFIYLLLLGYNQSDKAILRHTDEDDRMKCTVTDNLGRG